MTLSHDLHTLQPTPVVAFLHRDEHQFSSWVEISFTTLKSQKNGTLRITANHLIYRWNDGKSTVFASDIRPDDLIASAHGLYRVNSIRIVNSTLYDYGVYAPLTASGDLIVDGILVSCFAEFKNEFLARTSVAPLYLKYLLFEDSPLPTWPQNGIHYYVEWLLRIARFILPDSLFFSNM